MQQLEKNKRNPQGDIAPATTYDASGSLIKFTSRKALNDSYGEAVFKVVNGTPYHGHETNEYGIHAAFQALASIDNVSVVSAEIDLDELEGSDTPPVQFLHHSTIYSIYSQLKSWHIVLKINLLN